MAGRPMFRAPTTGSAGKQTEGIYQLPESGFEPVIAKTYKKINEQTRQTITIEVTNIVELPLLAFEVADNDEVQNYDPESPDGNVKLWKDSKGVVQFVKLPRHALIDPFKTFHEMGRSFDANYPGFDLASIGGPLRVVAELLASVCIAHYLLFAY